MCESSLGRQEPSGCRYVYGEVGKDWHYCQRRIKDGGRPGDPNHPPYCERHTRVTLLPSTEAARRNYLKFIEKIAEGGWNPGFLWDASSGSMPTPAALAAAESDNLVPIDVKVALANKGLSHG